MILDIQQPTDEVKMFRFKKFFTIIALLASMVLPTQALAACFSANNARSFRIVDSRTVDIQTVFNRVYRLRVGFCWNLPYARKIAFERSFVCEGDDMLVYSTPGSRPDRCWIQVITEKP